MMSKILSIYILYASMFLISSAYDLSPPANYTWPLNTKNLCFAGSFDLTLNVDYMKTNGANATAKIPLNNGTYESYSVSCQPVANVHELSISMLSGFTQVILQFTVNEKNETSLTKIDVYITVNDKQTYFTDYAKEIEGKHIFSSNESLFTTERGMSYRCNTKTIVTGFVTDQHVTVTSVDLENLRVEPFIDDSKEFAGYGNEKVCSDDVQKNSNLIPIIVGACLAVLVVIVLIAYLIGRRRSRTGYQTV